MKSIQDLKIPVEFREAMEGVRQHFAYSALFSFAINILHLAPMLYMMQIYNRVMSTGSMSTLAAMTLLVFLLYIAQGLFEFVRSYLLIFASNRLELTLRDRMFNAAFKMALMNPDSKPSLQVMSDLTGLRQFLTGNGIFAIFDIPWVIIYVGVMFMLHSTYGWFVIIGIIGMIIFALVTQWATSENLKEANTEMGKANNYLVSSMQNAEIIEAMGMVDNIRRLQMNYSDKVLIRQTKASRRAGILSASSRTFRHILQSFVLGMGAWLALNHDVSAGAIFGGSLMLGRALHPIDQLVGAWRGFISAISQYERLSELLNRIPNELPHMKLPEPKGNLQLEQIYITPPGAKAPVIRNVSLELAAGDVLGIIGPSASGKSTLARAILGIWPAVSGKVRLDGADISHWNRVELGPYIGYLPQDIELFDGSIADNICRFGERDPDKIVEAAQMAGVHEMILQQPKGYETNIGSNSGVLSGGQRQRIGLARAIYGSPKLLVLDEPNSNLDDQGERELVAAIQRVKAQGCTVVIISHRTMVLSIVDKVVVMKEGSVLSFGEREKVLTQLTQGSAQKLAANATA